MAPDQTDLSSMFSQWMDKSGDLIFSFDVEGVFRYANQAYARVYGKTPDQIIGRTLWELIPRDLADKRFAAVRDVFTSGEERMLDVHSTVGDGERFYRTRMMPVIDGGGQVEMVICTALEISEHRQIEEHLRRMVELNDKLLQTIPDLIVHTELDGTVVFINEFALKAFTDQPVATLIGRNMMDFIVPEDRPRAIENTTRMFTQKLDPVGYRLCIPGEKALDCEVNGDLLQDASGKPSGMVYVIRDIGARRRAEMALKESEERYKSFISQVSDAVFRLEMDKPMPLDMGVEEQIDFIYDHAQVAECNQAFLKMYNYSDLTQVVGRTLLDFHGGRDNLVNRETSRRFILSGYRVENISSEEIDAQGQVKFFNNNSLGIIEKGCLVRMWGTQTDITERRKAEAERETLLIQLQQAQKMESVGRLAGGVAHDFNNMLGVILGYTDLSLGRIEPDHPLTRNLIQIRKAAERSANLTRQLLAFARKQTVAPKSLDLNATVQGMLAMLERLIGENIELVWTPGKEVWPVLMDPSQLDQILANLCVNGRDAIQEKGRITIETGNIVIDEAYVLINSEAMAGEYICLSVSDNGCGMDKETQTHLFEPFFTTKSTGQGTGLGLATIYGIVQQNKGFINVTSWLGKGTIVKIYIPRHQRKMEELSPDRSPESTHTGQGTVLLVEDEPAILELTGLLLEQLGYRVITAATPGQAIESAQQHPGEIDLLLTDVVMPEMNGRDLAKNLLSLYPNMKRLFMSGYTADVIAHHGVLNEGVNFIQKPFTLDELRLKLSEVMHPK